MAEIRVLTLNTRGANGKLPFLIQLIQKHKPDFFLLQETNVNTHYAAQNITHRLGLKTGIFSLGSVGRGTAILQTSDRWTITKHTTDNTTGRLTTVTVTSKDKKNTYTLANVYAPSHPQPRPAFYQELINTLATAEHKIILAGDFNVTLDDRDIVGHMTNRTQRPGRAELQNLIDILNLKDSFRDKHPNTIDTTHTNIGNNRAARLDRIYTHSSDTITRCTHLSETLTFTDHKAVLTTINAPTQQPRRQSSHWKFNNSLLEHEEFIKTIANTITLYTDKIPTQHVKQTWDQLKQAIKTVSIIKAKQINKARNQREKFLQRVIHYAKLAGTDDTPEILQYKTELDTIKEHKYTGAQVRTRYPMVQQEKPGPDFLSLEQYVQRHRTIDKITDLQGNTQTDTQHIAQAFQSYYSTLFTAEHTDETIQDSYMEFTEQLTDEQKQTLDEQLTPTDLANALNSMKKCTAPGPDGLTVEFYSVFLPTLTPLFMAMLNESFNEGALPESQNLSYISLIPKDSGSPLEMKNYRPISLLNVDYKILTKALTSKLRPFMSTLIHEDQTYSVTGRTIHDHNHTLRDIITYAEDKQLNTCILSLDQAKAFDRVSHSFLHKVLNQCNFGPNFRKWIEIIYSKPQSAVIVNQTLSEAFPLGRSVRQGDPLSPLLYVLSLEPLLNKIRRDKEVKGIQLPGGGEQKLIAFADDTNFFPTDKQSVKKILEHFKHFGKGSGSEINETKTQALKLGKWTSKANDPFRIKYVEDIKIFGIQYKKSRNQNPHTLWKKLVDQTENLLSKLYYKSTSIFGRSILVNTLVQPKLNYLIATIDPPAHIYKKIRTHIRHFIFKGTIQRIRHSTLMQKTQNGGINLHDSGTRAKSYRLQYIKNLIKNKNKYPLGHYYFGTHIRKYIQLDNNTPHYFGLLPTFYKQCLQLLKDHEPLIRITQSTKDIYTALVNAQASQLHEQIHRGRKYALTDFRESFENLHLKEISPTQKQITYRILFSNTPTTEGQSKIKNKIFPCTICTRNTQETEEHIFFHCTHVQKTKQALTKLLNTPPNTQVDIYKAIFLNIIPSEPKETHKVKLIILSSYRHTIWQTRLQTHFHSVSHTPNTIFHRFIHKTIHTLEQTENWATFEKMTAG